MNFSKLETFLDTLPSRGFPMADCLVLKSGVPVYRHLIGTSDLEGQHPLSPSNYFMFFSLTKLVAGVLFLRFIERGDLSLDDPINKFLPEWEHLTVKQSDGSTKPAETPLLVRHLLTMTGGLDYDIWHPIVREILSSGNTSTQSFMRAFAKKPLLFEPGSSYQYSMGFDLLGACLEVLTGKRLSTIFDEELFKPLGMNKTTFHLTKEQEPLLCCHYNYNHGTNKERPAPTYKNPFVFSEDFDAAGAGLISTTEDYARFLACLSLGGTAENGYQVLKKETLLWAQQDFMSEKARGVFAQDRFAGYTFGPLCRTHQDPNISLLPTSKGEFGWDSAGNALALVDMEKQLAFLFMTHIHMCSYGYHKIHPKLKELLYEALD